MTKDWGKPYALIHKLRTYRAKWKQVFLYCGAVEPLIIDLTDNEFKVYKSVWSCYNIGIYKQCKMKGRDYIMIEKKLYNVTETSKLLGISKAKVYELINSDFLHAMDLGGLKIPLAEIDRFIDAYTGYSFKDMENVGKMQIES